MDSQLEFEPAMSSFLDDGFSNFKSKEERKVKKTARKEKRVAKKTARKEKRATKKGGDTSTAENTVVDSDASAPSLEAREKDTSATASPATPTTKTEDKKDANATTPVSDDKGGDDKGGDSKDKKILGMSKPVFFIGVAVVAIGGFFVVRSMMNKGGAKIATV